MQRDLKPKLVERLNRIREAQGQSFGAEVRYLCEFIESSTVLRSQMDAVEELDPEFDAEQWLTNAAQRGQAGPSWPDSASKRIKACWHAVRSWQRDDGWMAAAHLYSFGSSSDVRIRLLRAVTEVVEPVVEYLIERIGDASDILYLLERYRRRTSWFTKDALFQRFTDDTRHGEEIYDSDLRRFLFEEGIDYPFSKPRSASGEADLVANLEIGDDPLVCEVKLFDGKAHGRKQLATGFQQAISYAKDYGKRSAYLVIFNLSETILHFESEAESRDGNPRLSVAGVTVYLVEVQALPQVSASRRGAAQVFEVTREHLLETI